ncbi:plasma membrane-associated cation-binding protein 1 [Dorcoceras hygrometricum]|uniref:Plasma membrane-associated cation-binding protein 1 n=1 Tax=Dorcoceras hygrometricum TaxID=472368 RepID=A0A2Z7AXX2_9LAMI|nr:plasma membrane-associated cation-binding protein 1 [Dorcoceras hygrometricum]
MVNYWKSKEEYSKSFEDNKTDLQPKVVEIYEASSVEIKSLVKEPKESGLKKHSAAVQKFLDELTKIEFPGSKAVSEAATKVGPGNLPGPIFFVFEKVSTFVVTEEKKEEEAAPPPAAEKSGEETSTSAEVKEKEIAPESVPEEKQAPPPEVEKVEPPPPVADAEPPKVEEVPPPAKAS